MKVVVTGALGHIGSYLVRFLAESMPGSDITMIDSMLTQRFASLFNLPSVGRYRFIQGDVTEMDLTPIFDEADVVVHLAAITDAAGSFGKAELVEANNFRCTERVAAACLRSGARLVALSSTSVYGTQSELVSEDCARGDLRPQSPYAVTKLREEELVTGLAETQGLRAVTCRFGTIYGVSPGMRFHTAVNKFCWQAVMGLPLTVWTTALDQKRPYLDLEDAASAISFIIGNDIFDGNIYNVLSQNITVREVVDAIRELVPGLEVALVDHEIMNQLSYEVSCDRFVKLGFAFTGDLRRSIRETISLLGRSNDKILM